MQNRDAHPFQTGVRQIIADGTASRANGQADPTSAWRSSDRAHPSDSQGFAMMAGQACRPFEPRRVSFTAGCSVILGLRPVILRPQPKDLSHLRYEKILHFVQDDGEAFRMTGEAFSMTGAAFPGLVQPASTGFGF